MAIIEEAAVSGDVRSRVLTRQGVTVIRGGQTINEPLITAIYNSYGNIVYHPIAMSLLVVAIMLVVSEHHGTVGPLENILNFMTAYENNTSEPEFLRKVAGYVVSLFTHIVKYKDKYSAIIFMAVAPIAKPSARNIIMATIMSLFLALSTYTMFEMLAVSQFFYLHVMLRNPVHKLLMIIICAGVLFCDSFFKDLAAKPKVATTSNDLPRPKREIVDDVSRSATGRKI